MVAFEVKLEAVLRTITWRMQRSWNFRLWFETMGCHQYRIML